MSYKTAGYKYTGVGPVTIPAVAQPRLTQSQRLLNQTAKESDPAEIARLQTLAALQERYATDMAAAQQPMQTAAQSGWDPVMMSPQRLAAIQDRKRLAAAAAARYNTSLGPAVDISRLKETNRWDL